MSEIKQEILDLLVLNGRKPQTIKSGERVVYLYDALNIVNKEFSKTEQPQLNENQQVVFDWAKSYLSEAKNIMWFIEELAFLPSMGGKMRYKQVAHTYESLSDKEKRELLSAVIAWLQEQEAE